jgi:ASPIC and UnbV/FG-GAP-like repeat
MDRLPTLLIVFLLAAKPAVTLADEAADNGPDAAAAPKIEVNLGNALDALSGQQPQVVPAPGQSMQELRERYRKLARQRQEQDKTIWSEELLAQEYEETFVKLWDDLRLSGHKPGVFAAFQFEGLTIGQPGESATLIEGVTRSALDRDAKTLDPAQWRALVDTLFDAGYRVAQSEWHHATFSTDDQGRCISTFNITIDLTHADSQRRLTVTGPIHIVWADGLNADGKHLPGSIDATGLTLLSRAGEPMFQATDLGKVPFGVGHDDILAHDLDGDGLIDLVYPNSNELFVNRGDGRFSRRKLCEFPVRVISEAVLADFTGDGSVDYLVAGTNYAGKAAPKRYGLFLYQQDRDGHFSAPASIAIDPKDLPLILPTAMAVGDIDADGDLDIWATQYKAAYAGGNFPTPYYDANDGYPGYLLLNNGDGTFADATEGSGLEAKRFRRAFRASFVDLDDDGDLDLLVVSDFAGADLFHNDGSGRFTDVTDSALDIPTNFGMGHTFDDFNTDGVLDFYVTGMASTTARRLSQMGLERPDLAEYNDQRLIVAYGNRMYLGQSAGRFVEPDFRDQVARSGWSWGVASADFNNDGYPDLYVANGNKSGVSAKDYCTRFWSHDIYSGSSKEDPAQYKVFTDELSEFSQAGLSWNGFEHNHLFLSRQGQGFTNAAFMMGVALEQDSRAVLAHDFDNDGRVDLLVTTRNSLTDAGNYKLHLLRNRADRAGRHWVGVRLTGGPDVSPLGAKVTVTYPGGVRTNAVVSGDSYSAQHAPVLHFGLGDVTDIDKIDIRWPNGEVTTLDAPAVDAYHEVSPASASHAEVPTP